MALCNPLHGQSGDSGWCDSYTAQATGWMIWGLNAGRYKSYEGHLESKERFAIQRYLLIIGKKKNMQVL